MNEHKSGEEYRICMYTNYSSLPTISTYNIKISLFQMLTNPIQVNNMILFILDTNSSEENIYFKSKEYNINTEHVK